MAKKGKSLYERLVPLGIPLAWLQLVYERKRFAVAVAGITFAVAMMLFQTGLRSALYRQVVGPILLLDGDVVLTSPNYEYFGVGSGFPEVRLHQARAVDEVEDAFPVRLGCAPLRNVETGRKRDIFVIAFDPSKKAFSSPEIEANRELLKRGGALLFDSLSRPQYGDVAGLFAKNGAVRTEIGGKKAEIAGLVRIGPTFAADGNVLASLSTYSSLGRFPEGVVDVGVLRLKKNSDARKAAEKLRAMYPGDVEVSTKSEFVEKEKRYWAERTPIGFVIGASMAVAVFVGAVVVYQILYTDVSDHIPEYATLKAMGFSDSFFVWTVAQESLILSVLGFVPGAVLAEVLYALTRRIADMPAYMSLQGLLTVFTLSLCMCMGAGMLATRKLRKANPADVF